MIHFSDNNDVKIVGVAETTDGEVRRVELHLYKNGRVDVWESDELRDDLDGSLYDYTANFNLLVWDSLKEYRDIENGEPICVEDWWPD